jgi:hypothetical protein
LLSKKIKQDDLQIIMRLGSTEGIKQYLQFAPVYAFLSIHALENELMQQQLSVVDIKNFEITRTFQFIHLHGQPSKLAELFMRFCLQYHKQK